uniref:Apolipoprotein L n=1 Tax=Paramormyrops kingsleyae TaxID=1676925 RepID=A0A3B3S455_9TELE
MQLLVDNYISETLSYIPTVQGFLHKESEWFCKREKEMNKMKDIRKKANNMTIKLSIRMKKLEKELSAVVKDVISGLKELQPFLEALEKLAVTSTFVFDERLCWLPAGNTVTDVISFIHALDKMKKGADISGVAGSTVGVGGGVVSIVGLALAPVTLGASTILTVIGGVLGALSGVNSVATGFTQLRINAHEKNKFKEICNTRKWEDHAKKARIIAAGVSSLYKVIDVAVDCSKAAKLADAASDLADIGTKVAGKTVSTSLRGIFIAGGAAFIGLDLISITMNSISLSNGSKSDVSKAIRGHVDFWKIHLDAWEQICDSLLEV